MKKRFVKAMSMMLAAAMLITGVGFSNVTTVKAEHVYDEDGYDEESQTEHDNEIGTIYDVDYFTVGEIHMTTELKNKAKKKGISKYKAWFEQKNPKVDWNDGKDQININVYTKDNKLIHDDNVYTVTTKNISVNKKGYGKYKITVNCDEKGQNKKLTKTITVVPRLDSLEYGFNINFGKWHKGAKLYDRCVFINAAKSELKNIDGVEYKFSNDKKFKKTFASGDVKSKTIIKKIKDNNYEDRFVKNIRLMNWKTVLVKNPYWVAWRTYSIVDGKKIYSDWVIKKDGDWKKYTTINIKSGDWHKI